jgi:hypothetical protein
MPDMYIYISDKRLLTQFIFTHKRALRIYAKIFGISQTMAKILEMCNTDKERKNERELCNVLVEIMA